MIRERRFCSFCQAIMKRGRYGFSCRFCHRFEQYGHRENILEGKMNLEIDDKERKFLLEMVHGGLIYHEDRLFGVIKKMTEDNFYRHLERYRMADSLFKKLRKYPSDEAKLCQKIFIKQIQKYMDDGIISFVIDLDKLKDDLP